MQSRTEKRKTAHHRKSYLSLLPLLSQDYITNDWHMYIPWQCDLS